MGDRLGIPSVKEQSSQEQKEINSAMKKTDNNTTAKPIVKPNKPLTSTTDQKSAVKLKPKVQTSVVKKDTISSHDRRTFDINCLICTNSTTTKATSPKPSTSTPTETLVEQVVSIGMVYSLSH